VIGQYAPGKIRVDSRLFRAIIRLMRDLHLAVAENANTPLIPWEKAKSELGLD
jgi:hypothetical protein